MRNRSWLLVPGPREDLLAAATESGADVIVVDLEDPQAAAARGVARELARHWLDIHRHRIVEHRGAARWVRINALDTGLWREDLAAIMPSAPDGIVLPRAAGPDAVRQLAAEVYELEQRHRLPSGSTRIMPLVGDTPRAALTITSHIDAPHQRLAGLGWEPGPLAAELGAVRTHGTNGAWTDVFRTVRAQALLAARVCGAMAIDAPIRPDAADKAVRAAALDACGDGFTGIFATDAAQVAIIHATFTRESKPAAASPVEAQAGDAPVGDGASEASLVGGPNLIRRSPALDGRDPVRTILRSA